MKNENINSKLIFKKWYFWVIVVMFVALLASVYFLIMEKQQNGTPIIPVEEKNIEMPENQGRVLSGGTYIIGQDLPAGKYSFIYKTDLTEKKYWSNDYFYITRNGSEGEQETIGKTKYDERFGGLRLEEATKGKSFFVNLKSGDKIVVESNYGNWTY